MTTAQLEATDRQTTVEALQHTLVDLIDMSLQAKQAHWNVTGPNFRPVHEHLDELTDQLREWYDTVAERINALDAFPDGRSATVAGEAPAAGFPEGGVRDTEVVRYWVDRLEGAANRLRARVEAVESEPVTQDLFIEILDGLEKQRWMMRAQLG